MNGGSKRLSIIPFQGKLKFKTGCERQGGNHTYWQYPKQETEAGDRIEQKSSESANRMAEKAAKLPYNMRKGSYNIILVMD